MSALDGHESCAMCGAVMQPDGRTAIDPSDCVPDADPGVYIRFVCPHGCSEIYVTGEELAA